MPLGEHGEDCPSCDEWDGRPVCTMSDQHLVNAYKWLEGEGVHVLQPETFEERHDALLGEIERRELTFWLRR